MIYSLHSQSILFRYKINNKVYISQTEQFQKIYTTSVSRTFNISCITLKIIASSQMLSKYGMRLMMAYQYL